MHNAVAPSHGLQTAHVSKTLSNQGIPIIVLGKAACWSRHRSLEDAQGSSMDASQLILLQLQLFTQQTWPNHLRETRTLSLTHCCVKFQCRLPGAVTSVDQCGT